MDKTIINQYLNNFRIKLSRYLKSGVGIQTITYPFDGGAVIVIELGFEIPTKEDIRSKSDSLQEAVKRSNLFEHPEGVQDIPGTSILLVKNKILILKTQNAEYWSEDAVRNDVNKIISSLMERSSR